MDTLSYDLRTHGLLFEFFTLTHFFSQKFSMLPWKNTSFPRVIHWKEEQNRRSRSGSGWAAPMGCSKILAPRTESSWARRVQRTHFTSHIHLCYLQVSMAKIEQTWKTECHHLGRLEGASGPCHLLCVHLGVTSQTQTVNNSWIYQAGVYTINVWWILSQRKRNTDVKTEQMCTDSTWWCMNSLYIRAFIHQYFNSSWCPCDIKYLLNRI